MSFSTFASTQTSWNSCRIIYIFFILSVGIVCNDDDRRTDLHGSLCGLRCGLHDGRCPSAPHAGIPQGDGQETLPPGKIHQRAVRPRGGFSHHGSDDSGTVVPRAGGSVGEILLDRQSGDQFLPGAAVHDRDPGVAQFPPCPAERHSLELSADRAVRRSPFHIHRT